MIASSSLLSPAVRSEHSAVLHPLASRQQIFRLALTPVDIDAIAPLGSSLVQASVDAWSVSGTGSALNSPDIASKFFAASLFPYLALLWYLARPITKTPPLANFGFQFLLVFVFATIPAGIAAKTYFHDILANVDILHGIAESLLTVTNLLIIQGFRNTRPKPADAKSTESVRLNDIGPAVLLGILGLATTSFQLLGHPEPSNALSLPTWLVHTSSLIEWLIAMKLIWEHADTSGNPRWRGLPWAMIISHASGICACTYHLFYNSPDLNWIVNLQAALTAVGNGALAFAAYRVFAFEQQRSSQSGELSQPSEQANNHPAMLPESDVQFWTSTVLKSLALAAVVKYGELFFDFPFEASSSTAAAIIAAPVLLNVLKWTSRSIKSGNSSSTNKLVL